MAKGIGQALQNFGVASGWTCKAALYVVIILSSFLNRLLYLVRSECRSEVAKVVWWMPCQSSLKYCNQSSIRLGSVPATIIGLSLLVCSLYCTFACRLLALPLQCLSLKSHWTDFSASMETRTHGCLQILMRPQHQCQPHSYGSIKYLTLIGWGLDEVLIAKKCNLSVELLTWSVSKGLCARAVLLWSCLRSYKQWHIFITYFNHATCDYSGTRTCTWTQHLKQIAKLWVQVLNGCISIVHLVLKKSVKLACACKSTCQWQGCYNQDFVLTLQTADLQKLVTAAYCNEGGLELAKALLQDPPHDSPQDSSRNNSLPWCICHKCLAMDTSEENVCCRKTPCVTTNGVVWLSSTESRCTVTGSWS